LSSSLLLHMQETEIMPVESKYPPIQIPDVGIWDLLFHREQLPFPKDKSKTILIQMLNQPSANASPQEFSSTPSQIDHTTTHK
jgi:hypothetical protein